MRQPHDASIWVSAGTASPVFKGVYNEYLPPDSISFHLRMGFRLVGKFSECAYKFGRWYNMVWMEKIIGSHGDKPADIIPFPGL